MALTEIKSILEIKDDGGQSCAHTRELLKSHLDELDRKIVELQHARVELRAMYSRAETLDPAECTDANRCQVISDTDRQRSRLTSGRADCGVMCRTSLDLPPGWKA